MNRRKRQFAYSVFFHLFIVVCFSCDDDETNHPNIKRKHIPETHYILIERCDSASNINDGIAKALEYYAADPDGFAEIAGIILEFDPSDSTVSKRFIGLIESANKCRAEELDHGIIYPGDMFIYKCFLPADSVDNCWGDFISIVEKDGHAITPPGLEIYKGFDSDNYGDPIFVELIIEAQ